MVVGAVTSGGAVVAVGDRCVAQRDQMAARRRDGRQELAQALRLGGGDGALQRDHVGRPGAGKRGVRIDAVAAERSVVGATADALDDVHLAEAQRADQQADRPGRAFVPMDLDGVQDQRSFGIVGPRVLPGLHGERPREPRQQRREAQHGRPQVPQTIGVQIQRRRARECQLQRGAVGRQQALRRGEVRHGLPLRGR